jgi:hypothetical protein
LVWEQSVALPGYEISVIFKSAEATLEDLSRVVISLVLAKGYQQR